MPLKKFYPFSKNNYNKNLKTITMKTKIKHPALETVISEQPAIYVGTYAKYNSGSIAGAWIDLTLIKDEQYFYDLCRDLHSDEADPEFMFQDWQNIPDRLISESWISENLFNEIHELEDLSDDEKEAYQEYCKNQCDDSITIDDFREHWHGNWDSEEKFADNLAEELGYLDAMEKAGLNPYYWDSAAFARDLFISDYWMSESGNVFSNY